MLCLPTLGLLGERMGEFLEPEELLAAMEAEAFRCRVVSRIS
jgi:hypothetical protein